jgi:phage terminase Nu1 subunit (DNA packaging protein)
MSISADQETPSLESSETRSRSKAGRAVALPPGVEPLYTQRQLETYYGVSEWTVTQWVEAGMPVEPMKAKGRRFDMNKVRLWQAEHAENLGELATA